MYKNSFRITDDWWSLASTQGQKHVVIIILLYSKMLFSLITSYWRNTVITGIKSDVHL